MALQEARTDSIRPSSSVEKLSPMSNSSWKSGSSQSERRTSSLGVLEAAKARCCQHRACYCLSMSLPL